MNSKNKNIVINSIGILFLILGIGAIINTIYCDCGYAPILWICYIALVLIGIGALRKDDLLVMSQLNILAIPLVVWSVDFFYILITGGSLLGVADYFFLPGPIISKIITTQHLFTIPLGIYLLYLIKIKNKKAWSVSIIEVGVLFFASRFFTLPSENVNCAYYSCANFSLPIYYPLVWFASYFAMIFLVNFVLMRVRILKEN